MNTLTTHLQLPQTQMEQIVKIENVAVVLAALAITHVTAQFLTTDSRSTPGRWDSQQGNSYPNTYRYNSQLGQGQSLGTPWQQRGQGVQSSQPGFGNQMGQSGQLGQKVNIGGGHLIGGSHLVVGEERTQSGGHNGCDASL
uniref:Uncharacterized protein n=1 Tax=Timema shepardi TaxID=629360 RepID=A0A7R9FVT6_TIMSH|nr:unnamed protein product [Timema shepardi]